MKQLAILNSFWRQHSDGSQHMLVFNSEASAVMQQYDRVESRRLEKALTAFRRGPPYGNVVRITKAVKAVSDECYVENILTSFVQSIGDSPRYAEYIQSFNELLEN